MWTFGFGGLGIFSVLEFLFHVRVVSGSFLSQATQPFSFWLRKTLVGIQRFILGSQVSPYRLFAQLLYSHALVPHKPDPAA